MAPSGTTDDARPVKPPCPCPICKKMSVQAYHPFCSKRCADVDLSRWFSGVYATPEVEPDEEDAAPSGATPREEDV